MQQEYMPIIDFWFRELTPQQWFRSGPELDKIVRKRFAGQLAEAKQGNCDEWATTPRGRLALIILLDQFSRHIYRNTTDAFAQDAKAQQLCLDGIQAEMDQQLTFAERHFFYMPLMHSEQMELQSMSIDKFTELKEFALVVLGFAKGHSSIVERFGRFPHRNSILGRASTQEEQEFLASKENMFS